MTTKDEHHRLKPSLSLWDATAINVGAIIGAGIFVVTGLVAQAAGSALVVSMAISAIIAIFTALSFAELTTWQPVEGSMYEYARQLVSPFAGFLTGWMWIISNTFTGAAVSLGFAYYLNASIPLLPTNIIAAIVCLIFTVVNFFGVKKSARLNNVFVAIKLGVLGFFLIFGGLFVKAENFVPFEPLNTGVLYGAFFIFFAYAGFARVAVVAEEIKDAKRNVPLAVLLSLVICVILYILVGIVAVGMGGATVLGESASPLAAAMSVTNNNLALQIVAFGGLVATASVLLTAILGVSRMTYSMARRRDMPFILCRLHKRFGTPHLSIWIIGLAMALLVLFFDLRGVVAVSTFATLFYYSIANISALRLKCKPRCYPRLIPVIGVSTCVSLMMFILFDTPSAWIIGLAFLGLGAIFYYTKNKFKGSNNEVCEEYAPISK